MLHIVCGQRDRFKILCEEAKAVRKIKIKIFF